MDSGYYFKPHVRMKNKSFNNDDHGVVSPLLPPKKKPPKGYVFILTWAHSKCVFHRASNLVLTFKNVETHTNTKSNTHYSRKEQRYQYKS